MITDHYHFKVGSFDCIAVSDGFIPAHDATHLLFKNAPDDLLVQALQAHNVQVDKWVEVFTPLVIRTREHLVLVDTGLGAIEWAQNTGRLLTNLESEAIKPGDITTVIITHAHGDHVGGNADSTGTATFPNARYCIHKEEWDFWTSEKTMNDQELNWNAGFINKNLLPIKEQIEIIKEDVEIVPGIKSVFAPGHTPGNIALLIESAGDRLLYLGDAVLHPIHVEHPEWYGEPDILPKQTISSRRMLFKLAEINHALCIAYHFDFPGLGYTEKHVKGWKWQSLEIHE